MVGVLLSKHSAAEGWIAQVAERLPVADASGRTPALSAEAGRFGEGPSADLHDKSLSPFMQAG
jgi:hypothetical protein